LTRAAQAALDAQRALLVQELLDHVENHDGRLVARDEEVEHLGLLAAPPRREVYN
jgi:hypothetical protein